MFWDINVQCDNVIEETRPDIILIDKEEGKGIIIDIAVPADVRVGEKERLWKIVETKNGRNRTGSDRSPWKCDKRI